MQEERPWGRTAGGTAAADAEQRLSAAGGEGRVYAAAPSARARALLFAMPVCF